jgi:RNA polymerase sigma factor (sigma-70 family)
MVEFVTRGVWIDWPRNCCPLRNGQDYFYSRGAIVREPGSLSCGLRPWWPALTRIAAAAAPVAQSEAGAPVDVAMLVRRAAEGDKWAWERLVDQFGRLIWSITRDFRLPESDASDVFQATWLRLLEHIDRLEYPARVGSWIATTARHECLRCVAGRKKILLVQDDSALSDAFAHAPEADEGILAAERAVAVRDAMSLLPWRWQRMLELLMADPPASYAEISDQLGLPVGSIGPTRGRCMERLRLLLETC